MFSQALFPQAIVKTSYTVLISPSPFLLIGHYILLNQGKVKSALEFKKKQVKDIRLLIFPKAVRGPNHVDRHVGAAGSKEERKCPPLFSYLK